MEDRLTLAVAARRLRVALAAHPDHPRAAQMRAALADYEAARAEGEGGAVGRGGTDDRQGHDSLPGEPGRRLR